MARKPKTRRAAPGLAASPAPAGAAEVSPEKLIERLETPGADRLNIRDIHDLRRILAKVSVAELIPIAELWAEERADRAYLRRLLRLEECFFMWTEIERLTQKLRSAQAAYKAAARAFNLSRGALPQRSWKQYERAHREFSKALLLPDAAGGAFARKLRERAKRSPV